MLGAMNLLLPPHSDPTRGRAATPIAFIRAMLLAYERYGREPAKALALARIAPSQLADDTARVTAAQMETFSAVAMQELDDEALGWFSRRLPWGSYGLLCRASLGAPNLGVAMARWCRHHRLLTGDLDIDLGREGEWASLRVRLHRDPGPLREFCLLSTLRYLVGYACWLIDSRIAFIESHFAFPRPPHADVYALLFGGRLHFDAPVTRLLFDTAYLEQAPRRDEAALREMLRRALPLTVLQYRRDRLIVRRLRELLRREGEAQSAEHLAAALNLSPRSLFRQLREEGASLQGLKDEVRRERAVELLQRTRRPIKQIAEAVGFRNEKSFSRAFRRWTGRSPGELRAGDA